MEKKIFYCFGRHTELPDDLKEKIVEKMKPFYCLSDPEMGYHDEYGLVLYCSRMTDNQERRESGQHMIEGLVEGYLLALGPVKKYCVGYFKWSKKAWDEETAAYDAFCEKWRWRDGAPDYVPTKNVKLTLKYFGSISEASFFIGQCLEDTKNHYNWEYLYGEKYDDFVEPPAEDGSKARKHNKYRQVYPRKADEFPHLDYIFEDSSVKRHFEK